MRARDSRAMARAVHDSDAMFGRKNEITSGPSAVELQDAVMRFEGRFSSRLETAFHDLLESEDHAVRMRAGRDELAFMSSALDIAVGSSPEIDLLDMVTLVALGRDAMESRWSVDVYGEAGKRVIAAFDASLEDISNIARSAISEDFESELRHVIRTWQRENPEMENVAAVRLSSCADQRAGSALGREASGLLSLVRGAASTADAAVLLGERALYAAHRMPFLIRMHGRLATHDAVSDILHSIETPARLRQVKIVKAEAEQSVDRALFHAFLAGGGIALVGAVSWLFARLTYRKLTR